MVLDREFPPDLRVENEIEALSTAGIEVHLACFTQKGRPGKETVGNLTIHRKPVSRWIYKSSVAALTAPFYFRFWKDFLEHLCQQEKFDKIHAHDLPMTGPAVYIGRKYGIPVIADLHENWPAYLRIARHTQTLAGRILSPNDKWVKFEKKMLSETDHIIVVVEEAKVRVTDLGIDPEKVSVVSNTINLNRSDIPQKESFNTPPVLFYAGGIHEHRGLQTVIRAISIAKANLKFMILGEGSYKNELERLSKTLHVEDQVIFAGWKPYSEMLKEMAKADIALIPHLKSDHTDSTVPHKIFQYMYAGIPVISSDCTPLKRILDKTGAGITFPSGDAVQLAGILSGLQTNTMKEMGQNGKEWVRKKYNWGEDQIKLLNLYTQKP